MPPETIAHIAEQLIPSVVVSASAHSLLTHQEFGRHGFHCVPADPNGYAEAARCLVEGDSGAGMKAVTVDSCNKAVVLHGVRHGSTDRHLHEDPKCY